MEQQDVNATRISSDIGTPTIIGIDEVGENLRSLVGSKAVSLSALTQNGFDVPGGFVVTTRAYDACTAEIRPGGSQGPSDEGDPEQLSRAMRELVCQVRFDDELRESIRREYAALSVDGEPALVAVRSSSPFEDLEDASFAGQYDTFLNVSGADEVEDAVRRCWMSAWTDRVSAYRDVNEVDHSQVTMAVVVQLMVDASRAGVLHTVNPVTGSRSEMVIEAVAGLGEAVVSGTVVPDHYVVPASGTISASPVGCLGADDLAGLRDTGARLAEVFGMPQDAEWAIDGRGKLWLTQSRAVTTAFPTPEVSGGEVRAFWSVNIYQGLSQPFTPMGSMMIRARQRGMQDYLASIGFSTSITDVRGWLYWDITDGVVDPKKRDRMVGFAESLAAPSGQIIAGLAGDSRFSHVTQSGNEPAGPYRRRKRRLAMLIALVFPRAARQRARRKSDRYLDALLTAPRSTPQERLAFAEAAHPAVCAIESALPRTANTAGGWSQQYATRVLSRFTGSSDIQAAYRGIPANPTTEMDLALWDVARVADEDSPSRELILDSEPAELTRRFLDGSLPQALMDGLTAFLHDYGCRAMAEIDLGTPRWSDDPTPLLATVASYVAAKRAGSDAHEHFRRTQQEGKRAAAELARKIPWSHPVDRILVGLALRRSRELKGLRELPKLYLMRGFAALRTELLEIGRHLTATGTLGRPDDVMFLDLREVREALGGAELSDLVNQRREAHAVELKRRHVPSVVLSDGTVVGLPVGNDDPDPSAIRGLGAAAGVATGRARVVFDPMTAAVGQGEILVCPSTDPGWTPLFLNAAALVTETGGMISHGTTVAREYGIPAVVGVVGATQKILDGQMITVDGLTGIITIDDTRTLESA